MVLYKYGVVQYSYRYTPTRDVVTFIKRTAIVYYQNSQALTNFWLYPTAVSLTNITALLLAQWVTLPSTDKGTEVSVFW